MNLVINVYEALLSAWGYGSLEDQALQVDQKLASKILSLTLNLYDWISNSTILSLIVVIWTGARELSREDSRSQWHSPGFNYYWRSQGIFREAQAFGSLPNGTVDFNS